MTNNHFLPHAIVSSFLSCQILTCLIKESISLCTFPLVSVCFAFQHLLVVGKGLLRVRSHPVFWECTCTYFMYLFTCEWNLHYAALTAEAVTKPMCACGIFHLKLLYMVQAFFKKHFEKCFMEIFLFISDICLKLSKMVWALTSLVVKAFWKGSFHTL